MTYRPDTDWKRTRSWALWYARRHLDIRNLPQHLAEDIVHDFLLDVLNPDSTVYPTRRSIHRFCWKWSSTYANRHRLVRKKEVSVHTSGSAACSPWSWAELKEVWSIATEKEREEITHLLFNGASRGRVAKNSAPREKETRNRQERRKERLRTLREKLGLPSGGLRFIRKPITTPVHRAPPRLRGEDHGRAELLEEQVIQMRAAYAKGSCTHEQLATAYGVSKDAVRNAVSGRTWRYLNRVAVPGRGVKRNKK